MSIFIPEDYKLVAKTDTLGGGTSIKCYYNPLEHKIFFVLEYLEFENEFKHKWVSFGPFPKSILEPLSITIRDVMEMNIPTYIEDK